MPRKSPMNPRQLRRQERSRVTVEAILQATAHILIEKDYDKTNKLSRI
jgi:AcrR family transcriptional regulator